MDSIALPEMPRRTFMAIITGGLLAAPLAAEAEQAGKVWRIGWLSLLQIATTQSRTLSTDRCRNSATWKAEICWSSDDLQPGGPINGPELLRT